MFVVLSFFSYYVNKDLLMPWSCFFDRYLSRLPSRTPVVGVCFGCQVVERVPRDSNDVAVGWLATARGVERAGG